MRIARIPPILLAVAVSAALCGCGRGGGNSAESTPSNAAANTTPASTPANASTNAPASAPGRTGGGTDNAATTGKSAVDDAGDATGKEDSEVAMAADSKPVAAGGFPYAGSWQGTWKAPSLRQSGLFTLTVSNDGTSTGSIDNFTLNNAGTLDATTDDNGNLSGTVTYPGQRDAKLSATLFMSGGVVNGNFVQYVAGRKVGGTLRLNSVTSASNKYAGSWSGSWAATSMGQTGSISFVIATNGSMTGTIKNATLGNTGTMTATVDDNGNFSGRVDYRRQRPTAITGTLGDPGSDLVVSSFVQTANATDYAGTFKMSRQ